MNSIITKLQGKVDLDLPDFTSEDDLVDWLSEIINVKAPRWATESYAGSEEDFAAWMMNVASLTIFRGALKTVEGDAEGEKRVDALMRQWAMTRTSEATKVSERSFVYQLYDADQRQWFRHLPGELDTIEELLATMIDAMDESTSKYSDFNYIVKDIMPILRMAGAEASDVWGLPNAISKARVAVPAIRHILKDQPKDAPIDPQKQEQILGIAQGISNPDITFRPFRDQMKVIRGKNVGALPPIPIETFFMPGDEQWFVIKAPNPAYARTVEMGLAGMIAQVNMIDAFAFVKQLAGKMSKTVAMASNTPSIDPALLALIEN
jgi:hypothetical protein